VKKLKTKNILYKNLKKIKIKKCGNGYRYRCGELERGMKMMNYQPWMK